MSDEEPPETGLEPVVATQLNLHRAAKLFAQEQNEETVTALTLAALTYAAAFLVCPDDLPPDAFKVAKEASDIILGFVEFALKEGKALEEASAAFQKAVNDIVKGK